MTNTAEQSVVIDVGSIPDTEIFVGCSIIAASIKNLFRDPDIKAEYEAWLKSPEGQNAKNRARKEA